MATQHTFFRSLLSIFSADNTPQTSVRMAADAQDTEQQFLASIAQLDPAEQQKRIQTREMYRRMAQRQGIMDVERRQERRYWR